MKTKQISVTVLATPNETARWACEWAVEHSLFMATITLFPDWVLTEVDPRSATLHEGDFLPGCDQIWLSIEPFNSHGNGYIEIAANNPNRLDILLPKSTKDGLRAGSIGTVSADVSSLKMWRAIMSDLKKKTLAGLWVVNPKTGDKGYYKKNRFTSAVEQAAQQGLKLLPVAGSNLVQIGAAPE